MKFPFTNITVWITVKLIYSRICWSYWSVVIFNKNVREALVTSVKCNLFVRFQIIQLSIVPNITFSFSSYAIYGTFSNSLQLKKYEGLEWKLNLPSDFECREISSDRKSSYFREYIWITFIFFNIFIANISCSSITPNNSIVVWLSCAFVPCNNSFSLICDANCFNLSYRIPIGS